MLEKIYTERGLAEYLNALAKDFFSVQGKVDSSRTRSFIEKAREFVRKAHNMGASGVAVCAANSLIIDIVVKLLYDKFCMKKNEFADYAKRNLCIVALGGYGRSELCPQSDIDITFIYGSEHFSRIEDFKTAIVDEIMYGLWNCGLKLSHSSRTRMETLEDTDKDILIRTSFLDARLICGNEILFGKLKKSLSVLFRRKASEHILELLRLKCARHAKYEWTAYVQEPNIKNGIGSLRDFQTMIWIGMLRFKSDSFRSLVSSGYITAKEYALAKKSQKFLLRVRNEMHYNSGRENDLMDLNTQSILAANLGFKQLPSGSREGIFMRKVYFAFRDIDSISKASRKRLGIRLPKDILQKIEPYALQPSNITRAYSDGFVIRNGVIFYKSKSVFKRKPSRLIKLFRYAQEKQCALSESLEVLIKDSIHLIDDSVRNDATANESFCDILSCNGKVAPYLSLMHYYGVLGAFIPEFGKMTCLVQYEYLHSYTADIHTINTISALDKIFNSSLNEPSYGLYHKVITEIQDASLLYLMLFLHDIGKIKGIKGHAKSGLPIAKEIMERLNISETSKEIVLFMIEHHLSFAKFWQSHDIENQSTLEDFATFIGNEEKLRYLFVITFCDAKGTSKDLWNSYKESLHEMLYFGTLRNLVSDESQIKKFYEDRRDSVYKEILTYEEFAGAEKEISEHFKNLPANYFLFYGIDSLLLHLRLVRMLESKNKGKKGDSFVVDWNDDPSRSLSVVTIVANDQTGLFYKFATAFAYASLNILSSKIITREDAIIIDTFLVTGQSGGPVSNELSKKIFSKALKKTWAEEDLSAEIKAKKSLIARPKSHIKPAVYINKTKKEDMFILEIIAPDKTGLLSDTAKIIYENGFSIRFARINTERNTAYDTFHICKRRKNTLPTQICLDSLHEALMQSFTS